MKTALMVVGALVFVAGVFFMGQGAGYIQWPSSSSMINDGTWVRNGALIAAAGLITILLGRRS